MAEAWRRSLRPKIAEARAFLARLTPEQLSQRAGLTACPEGLALQVVGKPYIVTWPGLVVLESTGEESPEEVQALVLDYLVQSDGSLPTGQWLAFSELPHGTFYTHAFQGYTGDDLVRRLGRDRTAFQRGAERLGGKPLALGDAAYEFCALPRVPLAVVWWDGEEEIPPRATVLFDAVAPRYLPTDGLAILGRMLCQRIVKAAG